jgi:hypothetical protein
MTYDSRADTQAHIDRVKYILYGIVDEVIERARVHDASKLESPEKELFDEMTPMLAQLDYGTPEYYAALQKLKPALDHHYAANDHHPEHHEYGINSMDLIQLLEMIVDWKAASERHESGNIMNSIEHNQKRFAISDQLAQIIRNTAYRLWSY